MKPHLGSVLCLVALAVSLGQVPPSTGAVIHVRQGAPANGNGQTWSTAFRYLQDALAAAQPGDAVWVAAGVYKPDQDEGGAVTPGDVHASFELKTGVTIYGGFEGTEDPITFDLDDRDLDVNETTLSGNINDLTSNDDNSYHVVFGSNVDDTAILDGTTITDGGTVGSGLVGSDFYGGGVCCYNGSPILRHCRIVGNRAWSGGGLCNNSGTTRLIGCVVAENEVKSSGGAAANKGAGNLEFVDCRIADNIAGFGSGGVATWGNSYVRLAGCTIRNNAATGSVSGGLGLYDNGSAALEHCLVEDNTSQSVGGAIGSYGGGEVRVHGCVFRNNESFHEIEGGGAIFLEDCGALTLTSSVFEGNVGKGGGAIRLQYNPASVIANCVFYENVSSARGGGVYTRVAEATLVNCLFFRNDGQLGGAVAASDESMHLVNCTLADNVASGWGGGVFGAETSPITMTNCIVWGNRDRDGDGESSQLYAYGDMVTYNVNHCDVQGWTGALGGVGNISADPLFVARDNGWYWPAAGSPCVDAGDAAALPADTIDLDDDDDTDEVVPIDLIGSPRLVGSNVDIGAYEADPDGDVDGDGVANNVDNCLLAANTEQEDSDGDAFGDACDNCPEQWNANQADADHDGVGDTCDNCQSTSNADQTDDDNDAIGDDCDDCPTTPPGVRVLSNGCVAGDIDGDDDVDLVDYDTFLYCYNGPNRPPATPGCHISDYDNDNDVDLSDYSTFLDCYNGPNKPPNC